MFPHWPGNKYILLSHTCKMKQAINIYLAKEEYFFTFQHCPHIPNYILIATFMSIAWRADGEHSAKHQVWLTRKLSSFSNRISSSVHPKFANASGAHTGNARWSSKRFNVVTSSPGWHNHSYSTNSYTSSGCQN